jgi:hypothetical protein
MDRDTYHPRQVEEIDGAGVSLINEPVREDVGIIVPTEGSRRWGLGTVADLYSYSVTAVQPCTRRIQRADEQAIPAS